MKRTVIGLGTGRCGTRSLTKFFSENGVSAFHEHYHLPWEVDIFRGMEAITSLHSRAEQDIAASVAFYWLNYVDWLNSTLSDVKFICLKRDRQKVVDSFMRSINKLSPYFRMWNVIDLKMSGCNNLKLSGLYDKSVMDTVDDSTREWMEAEWDTDCYIDQFAECFPDYDVHDKEEYLKKYWDEYYIYAEFLSQNENFLLVDLDYALNTDSGRNEILNFIDCG